ncbi:hypothetical protein GCM10011351_17320 [Paraliobacillus quinghaiensis]|uniref:YqzE family protein n=1 Tax=Paraliobacillus quinghaiensis TaxID=470815 RepID=A0A917WV55_9BACI|nr:YqzE family protein [Paraliobacillus quinghaiensis]GGM31665.1 hypothetical protein GCM10011351_17320 [Paraliobacillus quinghaiensis]
MSGNDIVKYITEEFVKYVDMPKSERIQYKQKKKETKQETQSQLSNKWFGMLPVSFKIWRNNHKR